ncbi:efflux RND transporter periplasmic adaptor subunit [Puniceicoccales bacterium CK1056]|uniref:Efflux RND transporter periplasmic adaptor subunit n=1 Tax=Oceanipulchritudo coccoides TaxID=2706888 RepID=A0A6B2M5E2_9BACT|nr:efflux RND transporter periplasmic adaptor subunit [Oceanipulchritudo coccoides]NDV62880.1 efflux RND transporter periplasmic adaptor subunit [Oceanipulchritudo coccoides]
MKIPRKELLAVLTVAISIEAQAADVVRCLTEPIADVQMSSIVPGTVAAIHFGEGSFVDKGTVVLEMEARSEQLDIKRRSVLVDNLKATLERSEMLLEKTSSISMEEVDETRSEYQISKIELELAREALEKKLIKAPITGIVTELPIEVGEFCEPPQILLRIVDTRQFNCVANIDPALAASLSMDDPVAFSSERGSEADKVMGKIVFISPVVDPASGLLRIKAQFTNTDGAVRPGEGGTLQLFPTE